MTSQTGIDISLTSPRRFHYEATANVTKSVRLSLAATVEFDPQDTTEAQQVWQDVARVQGELWTFLLARATPIASPSTPN